MKEEGGRERERFITAFNHTDLQVCSSINCTKLNYTRILYNNISQSQSLKYMYAHAVFNLILRMHNFNSDLTLDWIHKNSRK